MMIFVTVGNQLPFDRLVRSVDAWAADNQNVEVAAQIGSTKYRPTNMVYYQQLEPNKYEEFFKSAQCIVAHAGMGTIISSLEFRKPLIVMPRRADKGEHRNDHQLVTVEQLHRYPHVNVVYSEVELPGKLDCALGQLEQMKKNIGNVNVSEKLISKLKSFIADV